MSRPEDDGNSRSRRAPAWRRRAVAALLAGRAVRIDPEAEAQAEARRLGLRQQWVRRQIDALRAAQTAADDAWMALIEPYEGWDDEDIPEFDPPPEQEEVDRLWEPLNALRHHDRWPRHLHWIV